MCTDVLTFDKEYPLEFDSDSQFKLLELTDRGKLKYPSEPVLSCAIHYGGFWFQLRTMMSYRIYL